MLLAQCLTKKVSKLEIYIHTTSYSYFAHKELKKDIRAVNKHSLYLGLPHFGD